MSLEGVLNRALDVAEGLGSHYTGTEHLLLTLTDDDSGREVLRRYGLDPAVIHARVLAQADRHHGVED